jgi:S1-C subfamily serine protease
VIQGADEITVVLADRREFPAELVLSDERSDLSVLRIDAGEENLPTLEFKDSDEAEVGDLVLAIGNPFGVGQTVTSGIISAATSTSSFRPTRRSIRATPAVRWSPSTAASSASTRRSIRAAAARSASASPCPRKWSAP